MATDAPRYPPRCSAGCRAANPHTHSNTSVSLQLPDMPAGSMAASRRPLRQCGQVRCGITGFPATDGVCDGTVEGEGGEDFLMTSWADVREAMDISASIMAAFLPLVTRFPI